MSMEKVMELIVTRREAERSLCILPVKALTLVHRVLPWVPIPPEQTKVVGNVKKVELRTTST